MGKRKKRSGICGYCGAESSQLTEDEVVAKGFFATPPVRYIRIMACRKCNNNDKSQWDNALRNIIVSDVRCQNHSEVQKLMDTAVRAFPKMPREMRATMLNAEPEPMFTLEGSFAGIYPAYRIEQKGFEYIVRGLYYNATGNVFPPAYRIAVSTKPDIIRQLDILSQTGHLQQYGPLELGEKVFTFEYNYLPYDTATGIWFLKFYDEFFVGVLTGSASIDTVIAAEVEEYGQ